MELNNNQKNDGTGGPLRLELSDYKVMTIGWYGDELVTILQEPLKEKEIRLTREELEILFEMRGEMYCRAELMSGGLPDMVDFFQKYEHWGRTVMSDKLKKELRVSSLITDCTLGGGYRVKLSKTKNIVINMYLEQLYFHLWDNNPKTPEERRKRNISMNYNEFKNLMSYTSDVANFIFTDCIEDMFNRYL